MSNNLTPTTVFALRQTNVSNPSVIHTQPSQQSITASEDYYSLSESNSSARSAEAPAAQSHHTITRFQTPPSRYRTPQQSREALPLAQHQQPQYAEEQIDEQFRKTPMRGHGKRRSSVSEQTVVDGAAAEPLLAQSSQAHTPRPGGIRRKPVPSRDMEQEDLGHISAQYARSSVYRDIDREENAPTPGQDDTPYIHFALDQLTRDEEVRGSRRYPGIAPGIDGDYPYITPPHVQHLAPRRQQQQRYESVPQEERDIVEQAPYPDEPPARNPRRLSTVKSSKGFEPQQPQGPNTFVPVPVEQSRQPPLNFKPGILRPLPLISFVLLLSVYIICLIIAAAWSIANTGLTRYGSFGDGKYFVFRYLPTMIGVLILAWLFEIVKAVYRIAPFMAMASENAASRIHGPTLPLQPRGFVLPYFGHFQAKQPILGAFLFVAWLQIFTLPLLASSFNAHNTETQWTWIAVQGVIWTVIGLYIILLGAALILYVSILRAHTGLKWDARSLADLIVLVERSNALDGLGDGVPQLGYFRTTHRPNEVFHTFGVMDKPARAYDVVDGQIREKRYSDPNEHDLEHGQPLRQSNEKFLRRNASDESLEDYHVGAALPWFLRPSLACLWPIVALVLLLAFLIVSYLPTTAISRGFAPLLPAFVDKVGFSATNFLYSFLPTLLATLCLLFWLDIDLAYRRLAPFESLATPDWDGDRAEHTLLPSYTADLPIMCTLSALFNNHLRVAFISSISLLALALPILASGVFWTQFYIPTQTINIYTNLPAYYALSVFVTIYALAYLAIFPPSTLRNTAYPSFALLDSFAGVREMLRNSRLLDDVAFRNPTSKTDLVTRLLSTNPIPAPAAAESKISLKDSVRGFGRARAAGDEYGRPMFAWTRSVGRNGKESWGVDRVRARGSWGSR